MSRVIFCGDPPWRPTGYGRIIDNIIKHSTVNLSCIGSIHFGNRIDYFGTKIYPRLKYDQGYDALPSIISKEKADYVVTCFDVGPQLGYVKIMKKQPSVKWYPYIAIDALNIPSWAHSRFEGADKIIVMSEYGKKLLKKAGIKSVCIPPGCNTKLFYPRKNKLLMKKGMLRGKFIVLSVGINQTRKSFGALLEGFAKFAEGKSDVFFLLHTDVKPFNNDHGGWDIDILIKELNLTGKCGFTDPQSSPYWRHNISKEMMVEIYNVADVGLFAQAEGFGLPSLEMQACGKPLIVGDQCTAKELVDGHGLLVPVDNYTFGRSGVKQGIPSVDGIAAALEKYYKDRALMKRHGKLARKHALKYDIKIISKMWEDLLK